MPLTPVGSLWRVGQVDLLGDVIHLASFSKEHSEMLQKSANPRVWIP